MRKDAVVVTVSSGFVRAALIEKLALHFMLGVPRSRRGALHGNWEAISANYEQRRRP
jgi:hypothetical protein